MNSKKTIVKALKHLIEVEGLVYDPKKKQVDFVNPCWDDGYFHKIACEDCEGDNYTSCRRKTRMKKAINILFDLGYYE